jgi:hypothetical protein
VIHPTKIDSAPNITAGIPVAKAIFWSSVSSPSCTEIVGRAVVVDIDESTEEALGGLRSEDDGVSERLAAAGYVSIAKITVCDVTHQMLLLVADYAEGRMWGFLMVEAVQRLETAGRR